MAILKAKYVTEVSVIDPDTNAPVTLEVYKHPNGGMLAMDVSFLETFDDDVCPSFPDPFSVNDVDILRLPSTDELEND